MNLGLAATLWLGGMNTKQIASAMTLPEHAVYNELDIIRRIAWGDDRQEIEALKL